MVICVFGTGMNWKCEGGGNDIKRAENVFSLRTNKDTEECLYCSVKTQVSWDVLADDGFLLGKANMFCDRINLTACMWEICCWYA